MAGKNNPEVYLLRYAFPCTEGKLHRGEIVKKEFDLLMDAAINEKKVDRKMLERVYSMAFDGIRESAKRLGKDPWDLESIADYYFNQHNKIIDEGRDIYKDYPKTQKEFCKVHKAKVVKVLEGLLTIEYGNNAKGIVINLYVKNVKEGDEIMVHQRYACENLGDKDSMASKYFKRKE